MTQYIVSIQSTTGTVRQESFNSYSEAMAAVKRIEKEYSTQFKSFYKPYVCVYEVDNMTKVYKNKL